MTKSFFSKHSSLPLVLLSGVLLTAADNPSLPAPPVAKKVPHVTEVNGHKLVDNYFWLRDKPNPEVRAYLEAENAYTDAVMKPTEPFQKKLYDEMLGRIKETDVDVPYREGDYFYYSRTEAGKQYPIRCRKRRAWTRRKKSFSTSTNWPRARPSCRSPRLPSAPTATCSPTATTTPASANSRWR